MFCGLYPRYLSSCLRKDCSGEKQCVGGCRMREAMMLRSDEVREDKELMGLWARIYTDEDEVDHTARMSQSSIVSAKDCECQRL